VSALPAAMAVAEREAPVTPAAIAERAPHREVRITVDRDGQLEVRQLYAAFDEFNRAYFNGALREPILLVAATSSPRSLGEHVDRDRQGLRSVIRLSPHVLERGMLFARDVLLHEMIHTWQGEIIEELEEGYRGHGPRFAERCNTIGAKLELPPVSAKGRGGRADCAQWPINVRPAGYYGTDAGESDRVKRSTKRAKKDKPAEVPVDAGDDQVESAPPAATGRQARIEFAAGVCVALAKAFDAKDLPAEARQLRATVNLLYRELAHVDGAA
jgi:hypothetical protein